MEANLSSGSRRALGDISKSIGLATVNSEIPSPSSNLGNSNRSKQRRIEKFLFADADTADSSSGTVRRRTGEWPAADKANRFWVPPLRPSVQDYEVGPHRLRRLVDRSGRPHRPWQTAAKRPITGLDKSTKEQLKRHPATGCGADTEASSSDKRRNGTASNPFSLTDADRARLRCNRKAIRTAGSTLEDRTAWQWPKPIAIRRHSGPIPIAGQTTLQFGTPPLSKHARHHRTIRFTQHPSHDPNVLEATPQRWCRFIKSSTIWFESSYFTGTCDHPGHPKVKMWNRSVAAHTTPTHTESKRHKSARHSIAHGRWIQAIRRRVFAGTINRPKACAPPVQ